QGGYSFLMAVDPQSPGDGLGDIIYFGNQFQARSLDAGNSFVALSGLHADTHAWRFLLGPGPSPSPIAGIAEGSSNAPAARPSRLSMLAGFRRRCSTTSTSRRTRQQA